MISVAHALFWIDAFRSRHCDDAKLYSVDFGNWVKLKSNELKTIQSALPWERMFEPIYRWQDETACLNDEWTKLSRGHPKLIFSLTS